MLRLLLLLAAVAAPSTAFTPQAQADVPLPIAKDILKALFKAIGVTGVDVDTCVQDISGADHEFRDFASDLETKNYTTAIHSLGRAVSSLSSSVGDCGVAQVQTKLDALAAAIRWANISTAAFDKTVKIIIGASDLEKDLENLATAVQSGSSSTIGDAIGTLLNDWTTIAGGCGSSKVCNFVDGLLRIVQTFAEDLGPCEAAIEPAYANLTYGVSLFKSKDYKGAVASIAKGLDELSVALDTDSCGLKKLASVLQEVAPKLAAATIKEISTGYQILVEYADVYDEIYQAVEALESGDVAAFGMEIGKLLQALRASHCETKACVALQGLLGILQLESGDFAQCSKTADNAWMDIEQAATLVQEGDLGQAVGYMAQGISQLAIAVSDCDLPGLAKLLEDTATKLGDDTAATVINNVVSILVEGADVTNDLSKSSQDFKNKRWSALGDDLGALAQSLDNTHCNSVVCKIVEGLLNAAGIVLKDLVPCEKDLYAARAAFVNGAASMGKKKFGDAVEAWSQGLNDVAKAVSVCGVADELKYIQQEANAFGFANVSIFGEAATVLIHGADVYEDLFAALQGFENHDYRQAGNKLGKVMNEMYQWTEGHACTSDICYTVIGVLQYLGDIQGSIKECESDLKGAWGNFTAAFHEFQDSHESVIFHYKHDKDSIKAGLKDLGAGFKLVASSVSDCHMQEFADLLEKLAVKLGIAPEISWIEELLHILIEGVHIEEEVGDACQDYAVDNWVGFGFNIAKLIKTLL